MTSPLPPVEFVPDTVLKRDAFSETVSGYDAAHPGRKLALRRLSGVHWSTRWLAWTLARREIAGLRVVKGIEGVPVLLRVDAEGILRTWADGTPLHLARPADPAYYRDAKRLLRDMRRRGVAHNDLAKPQNWLMTTDGRAAVIDFQLASVHPRRGRLFRALAYEDLRHLIKQKRAYAKPHLTASERRLLARRALPSRIWMATAKPLYNFVTRRLMNWSDGEGTEHRVAQEGPAIRSALEQIPEVRRAALVAYSRPARGVGLYAFVETDRTDLALPKPAPDLMQCVPVLPRRSDGDLRDDILELIANNRIDDLEMILSREPELRPVVAPLIEGRLNLTDRQLGRKASS